MEKFVIENPRWDVVGRYFLDASFLKLIVEKGHIFGHKFYKVFGDILELIDDYKKESGIHGLGYRFQLIPDIPNAPEDKLFKALTLPLVFNKFFFEELRAAYNLENKIKPLHVNRAPLIKKVRDEAIADFFWYLSKELELVDNLLRN